MDVTADDFRVAFRCVSELLDRRRLQCAPVPAWLVEHYHRMRAMSACGHEFGSGPAELAEDHDELTTEEVAEMLNLSTRQVRRNAEAIGGVKPGRDWVFDRESVERYADERAAS